MGDWIEWSRNIARFRGSLIEASVYRRIKRGRNMTGLDTASLFGPLPADAEWSEDEFALRLMIIQDPQFLVRAEKDHPGTLWLSDFNASNQDDAVMAEAIYGCLLHEAFEGISEVVFNNLVPQPQDPAQVRLKLTQIRQSAEQWIRVAAARMGQDVATTRLEEDLGKTRFVAVLKPSAMPRL